MKFQAIRVLLFGVLLLGGVRVSAGSQVEIINSTINFGYVTQNKLVTTDFWIKSTGDDTLKITTLWSGCGCTEIPLADSSIARVTRYPCESSFRAAGFRVLSTSAPP